MKLNYLNFVSSYIQILNKMKKLILMSAIAVSGLMYQSANAQIHLGIHVNLGGPVVYTAPAPVYEDADYYYLPDVEAYYSVSRHCYFYNDGYNWVSAAYLPGAYRDFDLANARRFEVHEARPYMHNEVYRQRFGGVEHRDWNARPFDNDRAYADRDRFNHDRDHDQYRGNDRRDNDHRNYQPQQNYGRGQAQPQQNYSRGQQAQPQQNYGRGQQAQPQQNIDHNSRGNDNRGGDHDRHGI
jgi:hypothetical protein